MTQHPTDDELLSRYFDETSAERAREIDGHVAACADCRAAWDGYARALQIVDAAAVPEPGPEFEAVLWARVQPQLPSRRVGMRLGGWWPPLGLAASLAAVVLAGWLSNRAMPAGAPAGGQDAAQTAVDRRERVMLTALNGHFEQAEMLLVEVMNAPQETGEAVGTWAFERATADDLIASSRLYRATVEPNGDRQFARVLEDLESVFVDLARSPDADLAATRASLRTRIDDQDLLFKVRAVTSEIRGRQLAFRP